MPLVNDQGGIINDPLLLRVSEDCYWFSLADSDVLLWAQGVAVGSDFDVEICEPDVSPLQVQGPAATDVMVSLFGDWVLDLKYFWFRRLTFKGIPLLISRTGWSNERGYEVFLMDGSRGDELWEMIMAAGEPYNISPACPNQIKRMEAGLLSYRNDMDLANNPFELGMGKLIDLDKPFDFIGKQALQKIVAEGVMQKIMGAYIDGKPIPVNEHRWPVHFGGRLVGELTSCVYSPSLERGIAYILLSAELAEAGQRVDIETPEGLREAELCELPFIDNRAR
jgi:aminomethyltransferase